MWNRGSTGSPRTGNSVRPELIEGYEGRIHTPSKFHTTHFMADKGYSGKAIFKLIRRQYRSEPIVLINKHHKKLLEQYGETQQLPEWKALYAQRQAVERCF